MGQDHDASHKSHRGKWIGIGLVAVIPLLLLLHAGWSAIMRRNLDRQIAILRAAGEPMAFEDFPTSNLPASKNASLDYIGAGNLINSQTESWSAWDKADSTLREFEPPLTQKEAEVFSKIVSENQPALTSVRSARGKQAGDWGDHLVKPYFNANLNLNSCRRVGQLIKVAALADHASGHDDQAIDDVADLYQLADASMKRPTLIGHLVAMGIEGLADDTLWKIAPNLDPASRAKYVKMVTQLLDEHTLADSRKYSWQTERICLLDSFTATANGTALTGAQPGAGVTGFLMRPLILSDARMVMVHVTGILKASDAPDWPSAKSRQPTTLPNAIAAHPSAHLLSSMLVPSFERIMILDFRSLASRRLSVVALAARMYAIDHNGQLPATLDALVPTYLPSVPRDPFSGGPLLYKPDPSRPRIYSVDDDGNDDNGTERPPQGPTRGGHYDIVVYLKDQPRPAPPPDGGAN